MNQPGKTINNLFQVVSHLAVRCLLPSVVLVLMSPNAFATWSVLAIDGKTNEMIIASATCATQAEFVDAGLGGLMSVQAIIAPGKGIAVAQAYVDVSGASQMLIYDELVVGNTPAGILELRKQDRRIERYQYAIADVEGRLETFSGSGNLDVSVAVKDMIAEEQIYFSVQGNTLRNEAVVLKAVDAFHASTGNVTDKVMAAMIAADENGGDRRCSCESTPISNLPCTTRTAHVAYLLKVDDMSDSGLSYNDGKYALFINVTEQNTLPTENANPVKTLYLRYQQWKKLYE